MSSSNALKYNVTVNRSYYAGGTVFLLYSIVIALTFFVTHFTATSLFLYFWLSAIAIVATRKAYLQQDELLLSESGLVERLVDGKRYYGKISEGAFYNSWFIFLKLEMTDSVVLEKSTKQFVTIYKDAITEEQYRLLARLINVGRS